MQKHTVNTPYMVGEVHFYSREIDGELVLFDTGPPGDETRDVLRRQVDLGRLKHVFITHCHVDHYGQVRFLAENTDARIHLPFKDDLKLRRHDERLGCIEDLLEGMGFDRGTIAALRSIVDSSLLFPGVPERYRISEESDIPAGLGIEVLSCPGHSQSDLVYLVDGYAITGDVLLRETFQAPLLDMDLEKGGRFGNYQAYCDSLQRLRSLRGYTILPGHRHPVEGLEETVLFYVGKLLERADRIRRLPGGLSVKEQIGALFGDTLTEPFVLYLKASEVLFMKDFLADPAPLKASLVAFGLYGEVQSRFEGVL